MHGRPASIIYVMRLCVGSLHRPELSFGMGWPSKRHHRLLQGNDARSRRESAASQNNGIFTVQNRLPIGITIASKTLCLRQ